MLLLSKTPSNFLSVDLESSAESSCSPQDAFVPSSATSLRLPLERIRVIAHVELVPIVVKLLEEIDVFSGKHELSHIPLMRS